MGWQTGRPGVQASALCLAPRSAATLFLPQLTVGQACQEQQQQEEPEEGLEGREAPGLEDTQGCRREGEAQGSVSPSTSPSDFLLCPELELGGH